MNKHLFFIVFTILVTVPFSTIQAQEVLLSDMPCSGAKFQSSQTSLRASGIGEGIQQTMAKRKATIVALSELARQISVTIRNMETYKSASEMSDDDESFSETFENEIITQTLQSFSYRPICEQYATYQNSHGKSMYKCYVAIEIPIEKVLNPIFDTLQSVIPSYINPSYTSFIEEYQKLLPQE